MAESQKKLAIIGASAFQEPLIRKAQEQGIETHVFAWAAGDVGEALADVFYPISITEKEEILSQCREIGVDGVATIGSDLANITVAYVAEGLGLTANSVDCVHHSTDKHAMRHCFEENADPSPKSVKVTAAQDVLPKGLSFPVIVKPADRSGSRGIARVECASDLAEAINSALEVSFSKVALVEEYFEGAEFSVEYLSWEGKHYFLALTEKFTTGAPHFIETGHLEPARVSSELEAQIKAVTETALTHLGVTYGASHTELKVNQKGEIAIIEIGSRMGGDCIGSHLVELSTGVDFVGAVAQIALGQKPAVLDDLEDKGCKTRRCAAIRFIFSGADLEALNALKKENPGALVLENIAEEIKGATGAGAVVTDGASGASEGAGTDCTAGSDGGKAGAGAGVESAKATTSPESTADALNSENIVDSSTRYGFYIFASDTLEEIERFLPSHNLEASRGQ